MPLLGSISNDLKIFNRLPCRTEKKKQFPCDVVRVSLLRYLPKVRESLRGTWILDSIVRGIQDSLRWMTVYKAQDSGFPGKKFLESRFHRQCFSDFQITQAKDQSHHTQHSAHFSYKNSHLQRYR